MIPGPGVLSWAQLISACVWFCWFALPGRMSPRMLVLVVGWLFEPPAKTPIVCCVPTGFVSVSGSAFTCVAGT